MPDRLRRTTRTAEPVRHSHVELFDVTCLCGQAISGQRLPCPQAIECPACGERLFVLPLDPYPAPDSRALERFRRRQTATAAGHRRSGNSFRRVLSGAAWSELATGRILLLSVVGVMTAGLAVAFWLDAQSRQRQQSRGEAPHHVGSSQPSAATYPGRAQDGVIVFDDEADLPDGTRVTIRVVPPNDDQRKPRPQLQIERPR